MEAMRRYMSAIWFDLPGVAVILGAFSLHFFLSLFSLYSRSTLRMPIWEGAQITLGILIFPLILVHIIGTLVAGHMIGFQPTYEYVIFAIWVSDPALGIQQSIMMIIVWSHMCMGLHYWLRLKSWYLRWAPLFLGGAVFIPVTAFLGFARVGRDLAISNSISPQIQKRVLEPFLNADPKLVANLYTIENNFYVLFFVLLAVIAIPMPDPQTKIPTLDLLCFTFLQSL